MEADCLASLGEVYDQQWTYFGWYDDDDDGCELLHEESTPTEKGHFYYILTTNARRA